MYIVLQNVKKLCYHFHLMNTTTIQIGMLDAQVEFDDFDVSKCYKNLPIETYTIKFEKIEKENMEEIVRNFSLFKC